MKNLLQRTRLPLATLCLVLMAILSTAACGGPTFIEYTHDSGRFSVMLPGTDPHGTTLPNGTRTMEVVFKGVVYMVGWKDLPEMSEQEFMEWVDQDTQATGTVLRRAEVSFNGMNGLEFEIRRPQGKQAFVRYLRAGNRVYVLMLLADHLDLSGPTAQKFLTSFKTQ